MNHIILQEYFYFDEEDQWYPYDVEYSLNKYSKVVKRYMKMKYNLEVEVSFINRGFPSYDVDLEPNEIHELRKLLRRHKSIMKYFVDGKRKKENLKFQGGGSYTLPF